MAMLKFLVLLGTCYLSAEGRRSHKLVEDDFSIMIVGGNEAEPYEFPWIVGIHKDPGNFSRHSCGGSIINENFIVTAGHCAQDLASGYQIVAGEHDLTVAEGFEQRSLVSQVIVHEGYDDYYLANDIALMRLTTPLVFNSRVQPAPLARANFTAEGNLTVAGWGRLSFNGPLPSVLMKVNVPVIPLCVCRYLYDDPDYPVFDYNICAGYLRGELDSCNGDSGGPIMCHVQGPGNQTSLNLCGLVSWGGLGDGSCAKEHEPGVYTAVGPFYDWIMDKVK